MALDKLKIVRVIMARKLRRKLKRKPREASIRSIFFNRRNNGESVLVRELRQDPQYHHKYFRMAKENFDEILSKTSDKLTKRKTHACPISPVEKLAVTLRYLATGNSQVSLAFGFRISPSSISVILRETMTAICDSMELTELPTPTLETWRQAEKGFSTMWNFKNCCGAIDGKHIRIFAPHRSGSHNFNYKGYFSMVLLAIVDARYRFLAVDIGASGSQSDGGVLQRSAIGKGLQDNSLQLPEPKPVQRDLLPHIIVGDDAFPLRTNLLKPFPGIHLTRERRIFNYRLSRARMVVENSFGILAARWRILHSSILADSDLTKLIVKTCVILHNYLINKKDLNNITPDNYKGDSLVPGNWRDEVGSLESITPQGSNNHTFKAFEVREKFMRYFNNSGAVEWQNKIV